MPSLFYRVRREIEMIWTRGQGYIGLFGAAIESSFAAALPAGIIAGMILGSHLSIAGDMAKPLLTASEYGFEAVAMFVRSNVRWRAAKLTEESVERFHTVRKRTGIQAVVAHGMYLCNLAGRAAVRRKSITALADELTRCDRLGIESLVIHPGSREEASRGIALVAAGIDEAMDRSACDGPRLLVETTAGSGHCIGRTFEQIAEILSASKCRDRLGVCLDTCHIFAAGYDLRTPETYAQTLSAFERAIGMEHLSAIHLNDAKRDLGSGVDRHEHIGRGCIGRAGFANIVNDPRLTAVPMILETPKGTDARGRDWDRINAGVLRRLVR